jgi:hypothetical protein
MLLVLLSTLVLDAQAPAPKIYGIGGQTCVNWLATPVGQGPDMQMKAALQRMAALAWATGYVTGAAAMLAPRGVRLTDTTGPDIETWLSTRCKANPSETLEAAAAALVTTLTP